MAGADVAEIAARHTEADLLRVVLRGLEVAGEVIHHLCQQPRPVDRVDGADSVLALERKVVADVFDDVLAIVEHPFNSDVVDVLVHQTEHLRLLESAHAAVRAQHEHPHPALAAHRVFGRTAGVAAGGTQDVERLATAGQFVFEQVAEQLHRHVLERERRAVGQGFEIQAIFELRQWHDLARSEHVGGVGLGAERAQVLGRNVVDVERQHLKRQRGVTLLFQHRAPARQRRRIDLWIGLGQVQATIGCQAFEQDFAEAFAVRMTAGREVQHDNLPKLIGVQT